MPSQRPPAAAPERAVLISVLGLIPAVLTETLWALASRPTPVVLERIVVITTQVGRDRLVSQLLGENWERFRTDLGAHLGPRQARWLDQRLQFGPAQDHVRVIPTAGPAAVDAQDIRSPDDHAAAADFILRTVRQFSEEPGTRIVFSVAGGRKTMGALLHSVAMLLGRPGDLVTHVLVNAPYEESRYGFPCPGRLAGPAPLPAGAPPPQISLAEIPLVPLRRLFEKHLGGRIRGYTDLVAELNVHVSRLSGVNRLHLDCTRQTLALDDGPPARTGPRAFALMLAYARLAREEPGTQLLFKEMKARLSAVADDYGPKGSTPAWVPEARKPDDDAHKALFDLRRQLQRQCRLSAADVNQVVPHRGRMSIDLPAKAITIR